MNKNSMFKNFALTIGLILISCALIYSGFHLWESTFLKNDDSEVDTTRKTIVRDGVEYFPRQDITTFLVMGIDEYGPVKESGYHRNNGEADMIMLVVFDDTNQTYNVLSLNRDSMVKMQVLGIGGSQAGTTTAQLALSHTYGSGLEDSGEHTRSTVSQMINGVEIDYYVSANMDAVSIITDSIGGVEVNVQEDFSSIDPTIKMGTQVLNGEQALSYVQVRKDLGDQMNVSRMERQRDFIKGLFDAFQNKLESNESFLRDMYSKLSPYLVSDCTVNTLITLSEKYDKYTLGEITTPEGENIKGDTYMEFYLDEDKFDQLVVKTFYAPK